MISAAICLSNQGRALTSVGCLQVAGEQISLLKQLNEGEAVWPAIRPIIESVLAEGDLLDTEFEYWQTELKKVPPIRNLSRPRADSCRLLGVTFDHSIDEDA